MFFFEKKRMGVDPMFCPKTDANQYKVSPPQLVNELFIAAILDGGHGLFFLVEFLFFPQVLSYVWWFHVIVAFGAMAFGLYTFYRSEQRWSKHKKEMKRWIKSNYVYPPSTSITSRKAGRWDARIDLGTYFLVSLIVFSKYDNPFSIFVCILSHLATHSTYMAMVEMCERFRTNKYASIEIITDHYIDKGLITYATVPEKDYDRVIYINTRTS